MEAGIANVPPELAANPQYEILRELGRGGMGVVYLAKNKLMDRLEVLKVVNRALLDHPSVVERFLREIRSAAKLSHPNVVAAYSALQMGELLAFAMEYVEGQDLASLVKSQGPLPVQHACYYVHQAALGLQHAHEKGMVHRDIKPQNLILAREGKKHIVKVLDFGLAKVMREEREETGLTGEGKMLGTPDYIAPEQTLDAAKADIRADIYSLGCTLYYLLSGHPPFSANSLGAILLAHQMQEAKALNSERPEVSEELAAVVQKMMAKLPAKRHQTPAELVQALSPFVKQATVPKSVRAELSPAQEGVVRKPQTVPSATSETRSEGNTVSAGPLQSNIRSETQPVSPKKKTRIGRLFRVSLGLGVPLLVLMGIWAAGLVDFAKKDGTTVQGNSRADSADTKTTSSGSKPNTAPETSMKVPASELRAVITKVSGKRVSYAELKGKNDKGTEQTITIGKNLKVVKGKVNLKTKAVGPGEPVEGGLNNSMFSNIPPNGMRVVLITEDKKLTEIRVLGTKKK